MSDSQTNVTAWPFKIIQRSDIDELSPTQLGELQSVMKAAIAESWRDRALQAEERLYAGKTASEAAAMSGSFRAALAAAEQEPETAEPDCAQPADRFLLGLELKDWIKAARQHAGWTQQQLADEVGRTKANVSSWEAGRHRPSIDQLRLISKLTTFPFFEIEQGGSKPNSQTLAETLQSLQERQLCVVQEQKQPLSCFGFFPPAQAERAPMAPGQCWSKK